MKSANFLVIRPSVSIKEIATPSSPAIFKFTIPEGWEYAFVHAVSDDDVCTMMTVQEPIVKKSFHSNTEVIHRKI